MLLSMIDSLQIQFLFYLDGQIIISVNVIFFYSAHYKKFCYVKSSAPISSGILSTFILQECTNSGVFESLVKLCIIIFNFLFFCINNTTMSSFCLLNFSTRGISSLLPKTLSAVAFTDSAVRVSTHVIFHNRVGELRYFYAPCHLQQFWGVSKGRVWLSQGLWKK